ncbi:AAA family ATPase [Candidatus Venteria ishoeyi]|uniref:Recombination protein F n=1 Tax=Candidatus Venteria ishoeyi TaxID=1899563 RepID=A0A1H6FF84_9GAMM|nr:ATP-binding protein [Candidatus Venteria ishoeyi]MDM8547378.1 AAA family ATPase [Candidatus Venteria ishoeyi]SEH08730.1 recombination protein F [Candidatus Venteria ishoeyi]
MIRYLKISNFKSINMLELRNIQPFSVFAGPNGSGKSNFFDAMNFVGKILHFGAEEAIRQYGGYENIYCYQRSAENNQFFEFVIEAIIRDHTRDEDVIYQYKLTIDLKNRNLKDKEEKYSDNLEQAAPIKGKNTKNRIRKEYYRWVKEFLKGVRVYKIDPVSAKYPPSLSNYSNAQLNETGNNLANVLNRFEREQEKNMLPCSKTERLEEIEEWLTLIVPGFKKFQTNREHLTGNVSFLLHEKGANSIFPARLISEGTVYLLCLLVAVFQGQTSLGTSPFTLIEEPERGLHPKAIYELVDFFREKSGKNAPIWLTTHSEAVIRGLHNGELWLVEKDEDGTTKIKQANIPKQTGISVDQMWLSNALNGGLPW